MNRAVDLTALVVDDDDALRGLVLALMREIGFRAVRFATLPEVLDRVGARLEAPDLIVLDLAHRPDAQLHRKLATSFPRATITTVDDGAYEPALQAAFRPRRRRTTRPRRRRSSACATPGL
jgi:hypothetical protein